MKTGLSYDDVCLIPRFNNVESRTHPTTDTRLTKNVMMSIPIVAANMDTVIGYDLARVLIDNGSVPIIHRFPTEENVNDYQKMLIECGEESFFSVGVSSNERQQLAGWRERQVHPMGFCVDIAHGHSQMVFEMISTIKEYFPMAEVIAGNVCTAEAVRDLFMAGADAVKVGIGPGSVCTTRAVTAFGRAQFSAVQECARTGKDLGIPIIADGGIKSSREMILALAAGASSVMIGGLFARAFEAAGKGRFRGQASAEFQRDFYGDVKKGTVPEGIATRVDQSYNAQELIDDLMGGLRSGMTYAGASSLDELQRKAIFERITPAYF